MKRKTPKAVAGVLRSSGLVRRLREELNTIIELAEWGIASERLGGNVCKEEHWKGQRFAATQVLQWLEAQSPNDPGSPSADQMTKPANKSDAGASVQPVGSADERIQSLRREGWEGTWMATVLRSGDEVAVVFADGTYFRGSLVSSPPNDRTERRGTATLENQKHL